MKLTVHQLTGADVYRDIVRIPEEHRFDPQQKKFKAGRVCRLTVGEASRFVVLRGVEGYDAHKKCLKPCIHMDEVTRDDLKVSIGQDCEFQVQPVRWLGQLWWALDATEIGYRISSQIALVSIFLGILSVVLTIALSGCGAIGKNTAMTQDQLFAHKLQCAGAGQKYEQLQESYFNGESHEEVFTYSPRLNTCLVLEQRISKDGTDQMEILDVLNNDRLLDTATTKLLARYSSPTYLLWMDLFNEANLAIDFNKRGATKPALP